VIDRLRSYLNRPIRDSERPRLFAAAASVIVAAALLLTVAGGDRTDEPAARHTRGPLAVAPPPTERIADPAGLPVPSEEGRRPASEQPAQKQIAAAKRAMRAFLAGYLPYTYGRRRASAITYATAELRRALGSRRPRVPAAERRRRVEVEALTVQGASPRRVGMLALVDDGRRRYSVELALARYPSGWKVTEVGG
jgi:hypothetical protein